MRNLRIPLGLVLMGVACLAGCGKSAENQVLDTDANGYLCMDCRAKFYTDREIWPNHCPQCKQPNVQQVLGFVCAADKHLTVGPRGRGAALCEQCRKPTSSVSIPKEADLKAWGAARKTPAEVGIN